MNLEAMWSLLAQRGVVTGPPPEMPAAPAASPWYVRLLLGVMGWFGGMMVLGFFGAFVFRLFEWVAGMLFLAAVLFAAAAYGYRRLAANDFVEQVALAASICGQALVFAALSKLFPGARESVVAGLVAILQVGLVLAMPNFLHRFLSALFAVIAMLVAKKGGDAASSVCLLVGLGFAFLLWRSSETIVARRGAMAEPVIAALAVALAAGGITQLPLLRHSISQGYAPSLAAAYGLAFATWAWLALKDRPARERGAALIGIAALSAISWRVPGLIGASFVLFATWGAGRRVLSVFALLALVINLSVFYYQMEHTLLVKSAVLAAAGLTLIGLGWLNRRLFAPEAA